jgi:hypothetical protein
VHRPVRLLHEEAIAVELTHLRRELQTQLVPPNFLAPAELFGLRALAQLPERGDFGQLLVPDVGLDHRRHGLETRRVAEQSLPVGDFQALHLFGGFDFLLRSEHAMTDHLAEIAG